MKMRVLPLSHGELSRRIGTMSGQQTPPEHIFKLLNQHKISPTRQRIKIAQVLLMSYTHKSADQILDEVNKERAYVSKATVYNTLNLFVEKGLINEVVIDPTKVFYDSNTAPHHHFYNEETGYLEDIPLEKVTVAELPTPPEGTRVESVEVVIRVKTS
jgi:Fur family iron response transcriptional regulator